MHQTRNITVLRDSINNLGERDREFAISLVQQAGRRGLSDKQWAWVETLAKRATGQREERPSAEIGDMSGILAIFDKAAEKLQYPAIVLAVQGDDLIDPDLYRLTRAGAKARAPGTINVTAYERNDKGERDWFGRIDLKGRWEMSAKAAPAKAKSLLPELRAFAADPVTGAKKSARLTGRCCFCHLALKDERSTAVGYGSTCAANYGLPWGAK